jgi:hypothetical protein
MAAGRADIGASAAAAAAASVAAERAAGKMELALKVTCRCAFCGRII